MKTSFTSLEELQKAFPIGSALAMWTGYQEEFYYNENDLKLYKKYWDEVTILSDEKVLVKKNYYLKTEGYLFDGEFWWPAYRDWDGWEKFEEEEESE